MTPKYYEVVDISEKPELEDWYDLIDPAGDFTATSHYFKKDQWFESEEHAKNGTIDEDFSVEGLFWLRALTSLPIDRDKAEKIWDDAATATLKLLSDSLQNDKYILKFDNDFDKFLLRSLGKQLPSFPLPPKIEYLKQFEIKKQ